MSHLSGHTGYTGITGITGNNPKDQIEKNHIINAI